MGGKIVNMILQFLVSLATARYLGPSNFGTINYVAAYVSFFSSIASLGLAVIVIREIATGRKDVNEVIWISIWMRLGTAILSMVCVVSLMFITNRNDFLIVRIAVLESLSILFSSFDTINYSSAKIFYLHLNPLNMGFVEQIVSPVNSTYAKGDRLTNQSAIQCLCGFTAFHSHVSRIWLRNYR